MERRHTFHPTSLGMTTNSNIDFNARMTRMNNKPQLLSLNIHIMHQQHWTFLFVSTGNHAVFSSSIVTSAVNTNPEVKDTSGQPRSDIGQRVGRHFRITFIPHDWAFFFLKPKSTRWFFPQGRRAWTNFRISGPIFVRMPLFHSSPRCSASQLNGLQFSGQFKAPYTA